MSRLGMTIVLGALLGTDSSAVAQQPDRTLPIREKDLLDRLLAHSRVPVIADVSVAPNGSKVLYLKIFVRPEDSTGVLVSYALEKGAFGIYDNERQAYLVVDVATKQEHQIFGYTPAAGSSPPTLRGARWSPDGSQVAILEESNQHISIVVYQTNGDPRPRRVGLPQLALPESIGDSVIDWSWQAERDEAVVALSSVRPMPPPPRQPAQTRDDFAWLLSASADRQQYQAALDDFYGELNSRPQRVAIVNLGSGNVRVIDSSQVTTLPRAAFRGGNAWQLTPDGRTLFITQPDSALQDIDNGRLMADLAARNPSARRLTGPHHTVYALDLATASAHPVYIGGPATIGGVFPLGPDSVLVATADPALSTWPFNSQTGDRWGRLRLVRSNRAVIAADTVSLTGRAFASDRRGTIYQADEFHEVGTQDLHEVSLATRQKRSIAPRGMSVSSYDVAADGKTIAAVLQNSTTVPDVYRWTSTARKWERLTDNGAGWSNPDLGPVDHLSWLSKDRLIENDGLLVKPKTFDRSKRYPLLVFLRGGNAAGSLRHENVFSPDVAWVEGGVPAHIYAAAGYLVFLPNHRQTAPVSVAGAKSLIGHYGRHIDWDVEAGIDMLVAKGWVDPKQIGILGQSHGSDDLAYAISHSRRYRAAILNDGPLGLAELYLPVADFNGDQSSFGPEIMTKMIGYDPVERVFNDPFQIRTPLFIRWANEGNIPYSGGILHLNELPMPGGFDGAAQTLKYLYALGQNHVPIDVIIDHDKHNIRNRTYNLEWQSRVLLWYDYFVRGIGPNPIPGMKSPLVYPEAR